MELIPADDLYTEARQLLEGRTKDGQPHERNLDKADRLLNEILNYNIGNVLVLYTLGACHLAKGNWGLAIQLLSQVVSLSPKFGEAWNNLSLAYKEAHDWERAVKCLEQALKYLDHADIASNMAALHINRNEPKTALKYSEIGLEKDPNHEKSKWHKALALLEMRKWSEAWDYHESRLHGGADEGSIGHRNYHHPDSETPEWDGKTPGFLVIHGEQGMGDEIMFASCIDEALKINSGGKTIIEPSPRLEDVFARSFPDALVYGTNNHHGEDWIAKHGKPDFKIAIGSLPKFFRRTSESFPGTPYIKPDLRKANWWKNKLSSLKRGKPNIGITWQGGVQQTRYDARSFHPAQYAPLFAAVDANWISLQYDHTAQKCIDEVREQLGVKITHWPKAVSARDEHGNPNDLDDLFALVYNLDLVVTVCQTAVHVAGSMGVPTICLTPSEPSWRYGAGTPIDMPWYSSVTLVRQAYKTHDWAPVVNEAMREAVLFLSEDKANANQ